MDTGTLLKDKVALITGASKGIGKALAVGFATAGASVSCAARTRELLNTTVEEIQERDGQALAVTADVTNEAEVQRMVRDTVEHFNGLDILVINAGGNFDELSVSRITA
jgi:NAD(P)-dependent dehydrogenase (short-subunit alcohol dehydrogenase family)